MYIFQQEQGRPWLRRLWWHPHHFRDGDTWAGWQVHTPFFNKSAQFFNQTNVWLILKYFSTERRSRTAQCQCRSPEEMEGWTRSRVRYWSSRAYHPVTKCPRDGEARNGRPVSNQPGHQDRPEAVHGGVRWEYQMMWLRHVAQVHMLLLPFLPITALIIQNRWSSHLTHFPHQS